MSLTLSLIYLFFFKSVFGITTLVIDPGHGGGDDEGAVYHQKKEAQLSLSISKELKTHIEANSNWRVILTRESDTLTELSDRVNVAKSNDANLFLSIHANASPSPKSQGVEFYLQNQLPIDQNSLFLASEEIKSIQKPNAAGESSSIESIVSDLKRTSNLLKSYELSWELLNSWSATSKKTRSKRIHQAPFYVLTQNNIPSVLVEVGFISNKEEAEKLSKPETQKQIASDLFQGLLKFKENIDKPSSKALH